MRSRSPVRNAEMNSKSARSDQLLSARKLRAAIKACVALAAVVLLPAAIAAYPDRVIRVVVPYAPGGNIDITARTIAPGLSAQLGVQVVVENRGGAGGAIGSEFVARAPADGYTALVGSSATLVTGPLLYPKAGFDPLMFDQLSSSIGYIHGGKLRALAVTTSKRASALPDAPTMDESGLKGFEASTTTGILLPAATPKDIVQKVYAALAGVLRQPATREHFTRIGADVLESTPEEFENGVRSEIAKWSKVIRDAHIRIE